jgi:hypothetical protein
VRALERATRIESEPHRRAFLQDALDVARILRHPRASEHDRSNPEDR